MCNLPPMICSDLDGTLLPYGQSAVSGQALTLIRRLQARGVLFCPASGRQYTSLRRLFAPVAEGCVFLCENGAVVYKDGAVIAKTPMPRDLALAIARDMWQGSEGRGEVMLSGENTSYLMERGLGMLRRIREIGNRYRVISDPADIPEEIDRRMRDLTVRAFHALKLSVYSRADFLLDEKGNLYCLEMNTLPGMTAASLLPKEAKAIGIEYGDLCELIIKKSLEARYS